MIKTIAVYGVLLGVGTLALQWLNYLQVARAHSGEVYLFLVAAAFLALGIFIGFRLFAPRPHPQFDGNPKALSNLGISPRELTILREMSAGFSNKEIAARLHVSPNTVKTHIASLFEKLGARRRTDAINKARALGLLQ